MFAILANMRSIGTPTSGRDAGQPLRSRAFAIATVGACLIFAAYAGSFLYFFVDDEAIPLVYARNLLRGRGFVYTVLEGRAEGYSDFLHVLLCTVLLAVRRALGQPHVFPLVVGKAVSFCAGVTIIVATANALRRSGVTLVGLVAALGFLALAGPLAVWSCSSLETVMFALLITAFGFSLLVDQRDHRWAPVALGIAVVLERTDGVLFVFTLVFAAWAAEPRGQRNILRVTWPIVLAAVVFHGWRYAYFGSLLSAPLAAKVLYRLAGPAHAITKESNEAYLRSALHLYGRAAAPALVVAAVFALRHMAGRLAAIALLLLGLYVGVVQDWMFGWRFVVALLPFAAIIIGLSVSRAPRTVGWCAAVLVVLWSGVAARQFVDAYINVERRPIFWSDMHGGEAAWLSPYYNLVVTSRRLMHAGDRVAYNQAGLLPYLLDLENIDDLGICSRFVAALPTTDVYFTGVGRYSPLTNQPVLRTAHAYLMYQSVEFLIARTDLLWRANDNHIPDTLLDGLFTRVALDASEDNAIYRRTSKPADAYRRDASLFTENLAHTTRLTRASIDGEALEPAAFGPELPFLRERAGARSFSRDLEIDLAFGKHDADAYALYIGGITSRLPCTLTLALADESGHETLRRTIEIRPGGTAVLERFAAPARVSSATIKVDAAAPDRVTISDMRLEGQSEALRHYLSRTLRFPPS